MPSNQLPLVVLVNRCFIQRDDGLLLIIKRSLDDRNNAEKWEVPGGKIDKGQDLSRTQECEVMEETGLLVEATQPLVYADSFVIVEGPYKDIPYVVLFSVTKLVGGNFTLSEEHTDHAWVSYDEMLTYDLTNQVRKAAIVLKDHLAI